MPPDITGMPLARKVITPSCIIAGAVMPDIGQLARSPPKPMGNSKSGSNPFTMARYIRIRHTGIMISCPTP